MIVLETDVLAAMMRLQLNPPIIDWLDQKVREDLHMTTVSMYELANGVAVLPRGKRKKSLAESYAALQQSEIGARVLQLTPDAANLAAEAFVAAKRATGHCDVADSMIAGIALALGATIATRNTKHFVHFGAPLVNPWDAAS